MCIDQGTSRVYKIIDTFDGEFRRAYSSSTQSIGT